MDHSRVSISNTPMSCAVLVLHGLTSDVEGMLYQIATRLYHPSRGEPAAQIVWSDVYDDLIHPLTRKIIEAGFGVITRSGAAENPRTGNFIQTHVWNIDHEVFKAWYSDERVRRLRKVGS